MAIPMTASLKPSTAYSLGAGVALVTGFLIIWTTIVHDDGNGLGFLTLVLAGAASAFAVRLRAGGMARAMLGQAGLQLFVGAMIATAPSTPAADAVMIPTAVFTALWLLAGAAFWRASSESRQN